MITPTPVGAMRDLACEEYADCRACPIALNITADHPARAACTEPHCHPCLTARLEKEPRLLEQLRAAITARRADAPGLLRAAMETTAISGESLIRQLLHARRVLRDEAGVEPTALSLPSGAGFSAALPQIARGCGFHGVLVAEDALAGHCTASAQPFHWEGLDGTRIPAGLLPTEANANVTEMTPPVWRIRVGELARPGAAPSARVLCRGRREETLLRDTELLAALHPNARAAHPRAALETAWSLLLRRQAPAIGDEEDAAGDLARIREISEEIVARSLSDYAALLDTGDLAHPCLVWNTLSFARGGLVSVPWRGRSDVTVVAPRGQLSRTQVTEAHGERRLLVEVVDAPAMGYIVCDLRERMRQKASALAVTDTARAEGLTLGNDLVRAELNARGELLAFHDKGQGRAILAAGETGNRFVLEHGMREEALDAPAEISVAEAGPLRAILRVERQLTPALTLRQEIRLEANSRRLDFVTSLEGAETPATLRLVFPVASHNPYATCDTQFGFLERPTHASTPCDAAHRQMPVRTWVDLSDSDYGVALLCDHPFGYDARGHLLRLAPACAPDGRFTCSLLPHRGPVDGSGVPLAGFDLNTPLRARMLPVQHGMLARQHSYLRVDRPNLLIDTVKRAEDGDGLIVRLFETYRRRGTARLQVNGLCSRATRTDLRERDGEDLPVQGGAITFDFRPFEIITLRLR